MRVPQRWFVESVTIRPYSGSGAYGDQFGEPVTVLGHISGGRRLTSDSGGEEVTSELRVMLPNPARLADGGGTVDPSLTLVPQSEVASGAVTATAGKVTEHRQPGTGRVVYVSAALT